MSQNKFHFIGTSKTGYLLFESFFFPNHCIKLNPMSLWEWEPNLKYLQIGVKLLDCTIKLQW